MVKRGTQIAISIMAFVVLLVFTSKIGTFVYNNEAVRKLVTIDYMKMVSKGGQLVSVESMDGSVEDMWKSGDIRFQAEIPSQVKPGDMALIYLHNADIDLYVMHKDEVLSRQRLEGEGYHIATLPDNSAGQIITIDIHKKVNGPEWQVAPVRMGGVGAILAYLMSYSFLYIIIGIILFTLAIGDCLICIFQIWKKNKDPNIFFRGGYNFCVGMDAICRSYILSVLGLSYDANMNMKKLILVIAPFFMTGFVRYIRRSNKKLQKIMNVIMFTMVPAVITMLVLYKIRPELFDMILLPYNIFGYVMMVCMIIYDIMTIEGTMLFSDKIIFAGLGFISICASYDIFSIEIYRHKMSMFELLNNEMVPVGCLVLTICVFIAVYLEAQEKLKKQLEHDLLMSMAYKDDLTQLYNRRKCNEMFEQINKSGGKYHFINFDMNGLKKVNDSQGHDKGDLLIKTFAKALREAFEGEENIFRMGGDEFLVILDDTDNEKMAVSIKRLEKLEQDYSRKLGMEIKSSYGIAGSAEVPEFKSESIYTLADRRMYEMKKTSNE